MDKRVLRIGDFVQDAKNQGYAIRVGISEMHYTELFEPIRLTDEFFFANGFKAEEFNNSKNFFRFEGSASLIAHKVEGPVWNIDIRNGQDFRYIGKVTAVHEVQNALFECRIYWKIKA